MNGTKYEIGESVILTHDTEVKTRGGNVKENRRPKIILPKGTKVKINRFSGNGNVHVSVAIDSRMRRVAVPIKHLASREEYAKATVNNEEVVAHERNKHYKEDETPKEVQEVEDDFEDEPVLPTARVKVEKTPKPTPPATLPGHAVLSARDERIAWVWEKVREIVGDDVFNEIAAGFGLPTMDTFEVKIELGGLSFTTNVWAFSAQEADEKAIAAILAEVNTEVVGRG